ncbi:hypothetical protein BS47DRAFT_1365526 [Hydnum rufescens UP504]|uniref:Inositol oxygenase n=1 Tax=Hydnum rufescens UP504 TaxID=1448309 RepID=A0A9P6AP31_9AGAM|nr:hypothetical protein BS47DRAFT_1365526 [Hydnum rufescens UP504]
MCVSAFGWRLAVATEEARETLSRIRLESAWRSKYRAESALKSSMRAQADATAEYKWIRLELGESRKQLEGLQEASDALTKGNQRLAEELKQRRWQPFPPAPPVEPPDEPRRHPPPVPRLVKAAEAIRRDGRPEWMQVVGLTHNPDKLLSFSGPRDSGLSWAVLSLSQFDERVFFHEIFAANLDSKDPVYSTVNGVYTAGCGLDNVMLSWGHGEYLEAVRASNPYDLYSKSNERVRMAELRPYYENLIAKFVLDEIDCASLLRSAAITQRISFLRVSDTRLCGSICGGSTASILPLEDQPLIDHIYMRAQRLLCVVASLGAFVGVSAAPNPMPAPLPGEKHQSGHDAFTLATGGVVTSVAGSVFTVATAAGGSVAGKTLVGHEFAVVSDQAGHIATLAVSGGDRHFSGSQSQMSNSAARLATSAPWLPAPIIALGSVAAGAILGAGTVI